LLLVVTNAAVVSAAHVAAAANVAMATTAAAHSTPLDRYLEQLKTLRVSFEQTLTDARGRETQRAKGLLTVVRPGRFRWELTPLDTGAPQLMVSDGRNLWFYDRDLEQVSVRPAASALTATPATLLSSTGDLRSVFKIATDGRRQQLDWVVVTPIADDADFREARLGFAKGELRQMILQDKLGQTSTLIFQNATRNAPIPEADVTFVPPVGADVIGKPVD
jgi:outer membrane lipoprotein carrier protein